MIWIISIVVIVVFAYIFLSKERRWIAYGRLKNRKFFYVNDHQYYAEEVVFDGYQEALTKYFKVVSDVGALGEPVEVKGDLYDWTSTIMRFRNTTIEIRHIRPFNKIKLVRSLSPMSIDEFELDNPSFK